VAIVTTAAMAAHACSCSHSTVRHVARVAAQLGSSTRSALWWTATA
jgi:hypothetical protein